MINRLLLGGAGAVAVIGAAFFFGTLKGREWCEARHERERIETQQQLDEAATEETDSGREVLEVRRALEEQIWELEREIEGLSDSCRLDPDRLRRLNGGWGRD